MPNLQGINHLRAIKAFEKVGFKIIRQGKHITMTDGEHIITKAHSSSSQLDQVCFASKNLYNKANYNIRKALFFCGEFSDYNLLDKVLKSTLEYRGLPA